MQNAAEKPWPCGVTRRRSRPGMQGHPFVRAAAAGCDAERQRSLAGAFAEAEGSGYSEGHCVSQEAAKSAICMMCGMGEEMHWCAVSPRVQERFDHKLRASVRRADRVVRRRRNSASSIASVVEDDENQGFFSMKARQGKPHFLASRGATGKLAGFSQSSQHVLGFVRRMKGRQQERQQEAQGFTSSRSREEAGSGRPDLESALTSMSSRNSALCAKEAQLPIPMEQIYMDCTFRSLQSGRLWMLEDLCEVLEIGIHDAWALVNEATDVEHVVVGPSGGAPKAFVNDRGLLTLALRLRSVRARKMHEWCQNARESMRNGGENAGWPEEEVETNTRERKLRNSRALISRWKSERARAAQLASLNPERVREETLGALFARARSQDVWRQCGETEKHKLAIYTQHFAHSAKDDYLHIKCQVTLGVPPSTVFKLVSASDSWHVWNEVVESAREMEEIDKDTALLHVKLKAFRPLNTRLCAGVGDVLSGDLLRPRDACVLRICKSDFREYAVAVHSVAWSACPPSVRVPVRAKVRSSGFVIEAAQTQDGFFDDMKTRVTLIWLMDMKEAEGSRMPEFLRQFIIREKCKCMDNLANLYRAREMSVSPHDSAMSSSPDVWRV